MVKGHLENVGLAAFTQLLAAERETCTLTVEAVDRAGTMRFLRGELIDAQTGNLRGEDAAIEIFGWGIATVDMGSLWHQARRTITASLTYLLIEAMRRRDEQGRDGAAGPTASISSAGAISSAASGGPPGSVGSIGVPGSIVSPGSPGSPGSNIAADAVSSHRPAVAAPAGHPAQELVAGLADEIEGFVAACVMDGASGLAVALQGSRGALDLEQAGPACRDSLRQANELLGALRVAGSLDDLVFTLSDQLHIIKPSEEGLFLYLVVDRERSGYPQARAALLRLWPAFEAGLTRYAPPVETWRAALG